MNKLLRFGVLFWLSIGLISVAQTALAETARGVVNADYVRVREQPNLEAKQIGFVYKNMVVEILSQTQTPYKPGDPSYYWYQVKGKEISGWVYGKFLAPIVANWDVDTYDAPGDMDWLYSRFSQSTWFDTQSMDMSSFSLDDYRNLMVAAADGNEQAWAALSATILPYLMQNPFDANYAYLRKRLYSDDFLARIIAQPFAYSDLRFFRLIPYAPGILTRAIQANPSFAYDMPAKYWQDQGVVKAIKGNCSQLQGGRMSGLPAGSDPKLHDANTDKIRNLCRS